MEKVNSYCKTHEVCQTVDSGQTNKQIAVLIAPSLIHQGSGYITYHRRLSPWYKARSARYRYHPPSIDQHQDNRNEKFFFFFFFNMSRERWLSSYLKHKYTHHTFWKTWANSVSAITFKRGSAMANTDGRSNMWRKPMSRQHVPRTRIRHGHTHCANNTEQALKSAASIITGL